MPLPKVLTIATLIDGYRARAFTPADVIDAVLARAEQHRDHHVFITRLGRAELQPYLEGLERFAIGESPLYGIPFVVKDNIDLARVPTTAGCPAFAYRPTTSAPVVERLIRAGAIPLGKSNLDQFATGLVGTRSPYGTCRNGIDERYIAGGSSSGSALAVALGLASFALGTDTAGSGRVPAAFNEIVGLKPSLGRVSTRGVVPACRSLDCVSVFARTSGDAARVLGVIEGFDAEDPFSRPLEEVPLDGLRIGVPQSEQLEFFGDDEYARLFDETVERARGAIGPVTRIDFAPFLEAAQLLYEGPWLAERYAAVGEFMERHAEAVLPVTREIIAGGRSATAVDAFKAQYRLKALRRACERTFREVDLLLTPTAGTIFLRAAVEADPIRLNARLGYYTNYVNLLDLAALALPAGRRADGLPFGITLVGPRGTDRALLALGAALEGAAGRPLLGASAREVAAVSASTATDPKTMTLAVCGAHMRGLALNGELRALGARFIEQTRTARCYRLFALAASDPPRPGLVRVREEGASIEVELWSLPVGAVGGFIQHVPPPLALGSVLLENGRITLGFLCETVAAVEAIDISAHGGWRAYLAAGACPSR